jgi:alkylhydroperoxidase/carboxymuconolactone decarboxylase family protein YurZ
MSDSQVSHVLLPRDLDKLRTAYVEFDTADKEAGIPVGVKKLLSKKLPTVYDRAGEYVRAIADQFYGDLPPDDPPEHARIPRDALSVRDRERCLIGILAVRDAKYNLAVHIYLALMNEVSPEEVANILLLAGMYGGVSTLTDGLDVEVTTLKFLKALVDGCLPLTPPNVLVGLRPEFAY